MVTMNPTAADEFLEQRMSLLSEIEAHLILRISQLTHETLQKLGDTAHCCKPL